MSLRVTFELGKSDLDHFRTIMRQARKTSVELTPDAVLEAARGLMESVKGIELPDFVRGRLEKIKVLIDMVEDSEWRLPKEETGRVLNALAYFSEPEDLIPDHVPGLGFLDDAIMVELVCREFRFEIQAYTRFCRMREVEEKRGDRSRFTSEDTRQLWLEGRRKELVSWMRERRRGRSRSRKSASAGSSPFSLFR